MSTSNTPAAGSHLTADQRSGIDAAARELAQKERASRTETYRREAIKEINRWATAHCKYLVEMHNLDELLPGKVHVTLKKPKSYYEAQFEAVAMMTRDTYLLDRPVKALIAELFPEACRRAGHTGRLPESVWYNEFSPPLQKRVTNYLVGFKPTKDCNTLSKVTALIKAGRKFRNAAEEKYTGRDFPQGRFQFNGNGTVCWFGNELTIQTKGKSRIAYVRVGGKYKNVLKTLDELGVDRATAGQWVENAEVSYHKRQQHEALHDENLKTFGMKYD
jgi:hypothetical protein